MEQYPSEEAGFDFAAHEAEFLLVDIAAEQAQTARRQQFIQEFSATHPDYNHQLFLLEFATAAERSNYPEIAEQHKVEEYIDKIASLPVVSEEIVRQHSRVDPYFAAALSRTKLDFAAHARSLYGASSWWLEAMFDQRLKLEPILTYTSDLEVITSYVQAYGVSPHEERRFDVALQRSYRDLIDKAHLEFLEFSPHIRQALGEYAYSWGVASGRRCWIQNRVGLSAEARAQSDAAYRGLVQTVLHAAGVFSMVQGIPRQAWTPPFGQAAIIVAAYFTEVLQQDEV